MKGWGARGDLLSKVVGDSIKSILHFLFSACQVEALFHTSDGRGRLIIPKEISGIIAPPIVICLQKALEKKINTRLIPAGKRFSFSVFLSVLPCLPAAGGGGGGGSFSRNGLVVIASSEPRSRAIPP